VPASMAFIYDMSEPLILVSLRLAGTVAASCFMKVEFWAMIFFNILFTWCDRQHFFPDSVLIELTDDMLTTITGLMVFLTVFYTNDCFARYCELYTGTRQVLGMLSDYVSEIVLRIPEQPKRRACIKYVVAAASVFYHEVKFGMEIEDEWRVVPSLHAARLLTDREMDQVFIHGGEAWFLLLHWSLQGAKDALGESRLRYLKTLGDKIYKLRSLMANVRDIVDHPMPFQYYHLMNLLLTANLVLWAYTAGRLQNMFAPFLYFVMTLIFFGLRELAGALSDPFGDDIVDFPVQVWLDESYSMALNLLESEFVPEYDVNVTSPFRVLDEANESIFSEIAPDTLQDLQGWIPDPDQDVDLAGMAQRFSRDASHPLAHTHATETVIDAVGSHAPIVKRTTAVTRRHQKQHQVRHHSRSNTTDPVEILRSVSQAARES